MSGIGGFKGVSASQDARFVNKQKRMLKTKKFPKELDSPVDYARVDWSVIREWTAKRVTELLGVEDEVLIQFIHNRLEELNQKLSDLNPKELFLELMPFLEKNTGLFMKELWTLLASASANEFGIPQQIIDAKAKELQQKKNQQSIIAATIEEQREKANDDSTSDQDNPDKKPEKKKRFVPPAGDGHNLPSYPEYDRLLHSGSKKKADRWNRRPFASPRGQNSRYRGRGRRHPSRSRSRSPKRSHRHRRSGFRHDRSFSKEREKQPLTVKQRRPRSTSPRSRRDSNRDKIADKREKQPSHQALLDQVRSRSPPLSRYSSPQQHGHGLRLARRQRYRDVKLRSPDRRHHSNTPSTRSPSPRSRNGMSPTPEVREGNPSPSSHPSMHGEREALRTPSPTPRPPTPKTRTPPRYDRERDRERDRDRDRDREFERRDSRRMEQRPMRRQYGYPDDDGYRRQGYMFKRSPLHTNSHRQSERRLGRWTNEGRTRRDGEWMRRDDERMRRDDHYSRRSPRDDRRLSGIRDQQGWRGRDRFRRHSFSPREPRYPTYNSPRRDSRRSPPMHRDRDDALKETVLDKEVTMSRDSPRNECEEQKPRSMDNDEVTNEAVSDNDRDATSVSLEDAMEPQKQQQTKERLKRKLKEILEKKDSLNLD